VVEKKLAELKSLHPQGTKWIDEISKEQWCRAYNKKGHR